MILQFDEQSLAKKLLLRLRDSRQFTHPGRSHLVDLWACHGRYELAEVTHRGRGRSRRAGGGRQVERG